MRLLLTADPGLPVPPPLYGGIERIIASLAEKLVARGHEIGLLADRDSTCRATSSFVWPARPAGIAGHLQSLHRAVHTFRPEVVHSFSRLAYLTSILTRRGLPKVMSFQREPTQWTVRWASRLARGSLAFTGCSDYIRNKGRVAGGTWHTIYNFVDLERYTFAPQVPDDAPLVFLSRIEPIKGTHLAIEACRRTGRHLIIAGNHSDRDDDEGRYWREHVRSQIDGTNVEYVGPVDDQQKNQLLGSAAALIVPIQWDEPFGIVFAEALACGTPVISSPQGALPEIVRDGTDGFLASNGDQLADAIERVGEISRKSCRERAERCFSSANVVPQYEALYNSIYGASK